jgi:hypothetical protein
VHPHVIPLKIRNITHDITCKLVNRLFVVHPKVLPLKYISPVVVISLESEVGRQISPALDRWRRVVAKICIHIIQLHMVYFMRCTREIQHMYHICKDIHTSQSYRKLIKVVSKEI